MGGDPSCSCNEFTARILSIKRKLSAFLSSFTHPFSHLSPAILSSFSCNYIIFLLQFPHLSTAILSSFSCNYIIFLLQLYHLSPAILSYFSCNSLIFLMQFSHLSPAILYSCSCNYLICTSFSCISLSFYYNCVTVHLSLAFL